MTSKMLSSNGVIPKGTFPYGNFDMVDTDGPISRVGSEKYKEWVVKAINTGYLRRLEKVDEIPDLGKGVEVFGSGERGIFRGGIKEYLITSRGNVKANWIKEEEKAYVMSKYTGKKHKIPLLRDITLHDTFKTQQGKVAMSTIHKHIEKLECYACHATWAPQCFGCHMQYDKRVKGTDWIATSRKVNPTSGRQTVTEDFGDLSLENRSKICHSRRTDH